MFKRKRRPAVTDERGLRDILPRDLDLEDEIGRLARNQPQGRRPVPFSPPSHDPVQLAGQTIKSVAKLGSDSAKEIEETADSIITSAEAVAQHLRDLSAAIRGHSDKASLIVEAHCQKLGKAVESIREISAEFHAQPKPEEPSQ